MQQIVQYNVEINCGECPEGITAQIAERLGAAFPVTACRSVGNGLELRLVSGHPLADGALRDFADLVGDTLSGLGITMTMGVVRRVTREGSGRGGVLGKAQDLAIALTGFDWRPVREVPALYFYKGLSLDLELTARLQALDGTNRADAVRQPDWRAAQPSGVASRAT